MRIPKIRVSLEVAVRIEKKRKKITHINRLQMMVLENGKEHNVFYFLSIFIFGWSVSFTAYQLLLGYLMTQHSHIFFSSNYIDSSNE